MNKYNVSIGDLVIPNNKSIILYVTKVDDEFIHYKIYYLKYVKSNTFRGLTHNKQYLNIFNRWIHDTTWHIIYRKRI